LSIDEHPPRGQPWLERASALANTASAFR